MKLRLSSIVVAVMLVFVVHAQSAEAEEQIKQVSFRVGNIYCGACANAVKAALQAHPGVTALAVTADHVFKVSYDSERTSIRLLRKTIVGTKHPHQGAKFTATLLQ